MHAREAEVNAQREEDALELLHRCVIDGSVPSDPMIRDEFERLAPWWRRACDSVNNVLPDVILQDEARAAVHWCINLAKELVDAERAIRSGKTFDRTLLNHTRQLVWERFGNLERGLMSNGIERPK